MKVIIISGDYKRCFGTLMSYNSRTETGDIKVELPNGDVTWLFDQKEGTHFLIVKNQVA